MSCETNPLLTMLNALTLIRDESDSLGVDGCAEIAADAINGMRDRAVKA